MNLTLIIQTLVGYRQLILDQNTRLIHNSCINKSCNRPFPYYISRFSMSVAEEVTPQVLGFTDSAANKMKLLIEDEANPDLKLRVFVTGGGCAGFQYGFTMDEIAAEDDAVIKKEGVSLLVDPLSYQYLVGGQVDYTEGLEGSRFVITNPNATTTCGCGSSFSI
jgi:iron-sulfur cluster insertion protein